MSARAAHRAERWALGQALSAGEPCRADRETMLAALRDVAALAARWQGSMAEPGRAAAADVMEASAGTSVARAMAQAGRPAEAMAEIPEEQPGQPADAGLHTYSQRLQGRVPLARPLGEGTIQPDGSEIPEEDQPWRSGGEVPGG